MNQSVNHTIFVTGMQRSGTTLTDKLLASHPELRIYSQPLPMLFVGVKRAFLQTLGLNTTYPLGHYFGPLGYTLEDFTDFLRHHQVSLGDVEAALQQMRNFSGQYTEIGNKAGARLTNGLTETSFAPVLATLLGRLEGSDKSVRYTGSKETLCEEYIPYLLEAGSRVVLVVRDPRDVICSLNYGKGREFAGSLKPTLFNLRHWRKSVALALTFRHNPHFSVIRYEDLARDAVGALNTLTGMLGVTAISKRDLAEVLDQNGVSWHGNSSFGELKGLSTQAVRRFESILPEKVRRYIEAICLPELHTMGYEANMTLAESESVIAAFKEPYEITRAGLVGYSDDPLNVDLEIQRIRLLQTRSSLDDVSMFVTIEAGHALAEECVHAGL